MWPRRSKPVVFALAFSLCAVPSTFPQNKNHEKREKHEKDKTVWNYEGGVFFVTDGSLPTGVCFRINGRMTSDDFFDGLKRIDTDEGTVFQRGTEPVTVFPDSVTVSFAIRDQLCPTEIEHADAQAYLTEKMIDELRLSIYWKHGVDLQPAQGVKKVETRVDRINPYASASATDLPPRYEWSYVLKVPSAGVPLMDSLAFVFRTEDGRIAARVSGRL